MQKIIIVEDDQFLREELENIYHKAGYEVCCVTDFPETGAVCEAEHPDLLVLDLGLPGISGFALCKEIRKKGSLPILVLTSRDKMQDELKALELGADEYLTKPCHKDRLLARTENLLKRAMGNAHLLDGDDFLFDTRTYTVCQGKDACHIPENQGKILKILLEYAGTEVKKECISKVLWGTTEYIDENALQVNVTRLKKTLKALEMVSLSDKLKNRPPELSGGQRQRVAIARAIVNSPKIILADEPTGNLDSHSEVEIMNIFKELNRRGVTIVMVTHEPEIAANSRRVITVKDGMVIGDKETEKRGE